MLYQFKCLECDHLQEYAFPVSEWDIHVTEDDRLKRIKCKNCGKLKLHRYISNMPSVLGGTNGYVSMERYWSKDPSRRRIEEEKLQKENERHKNFKNDAIKRQEAGEKIGPRLKGQE